MQLDAMHQRLAAYVDRGDVPGSVALVARGDEVQVDARATTPARPARTAGTAASERASASIRSARS